MIRRILSHFVLLLVFGAAAAQAADVKRFELLKGIHYYQINEGASVIQTNNMYRFAAQVYANAPGGVLGASVINSRAQRIDLQPDRDGDPFRFRDSFDDAFGLTGNFPNGAYQLLVNTAYDGNRTLSFSITGDTYPSAPVLNNYNVAQELIYNQYNVISWQPFIGGESSDFIQLQIEDAAGNNAWESPDYGEAGALNGLDTHVILPPNSLNPGATYVGTIRFVNVLQSFAREYPGVRGTAGYFTRTEFRMGAISTGLTRNLERVTLWKTARYEQFTNTAPRVLPFEFAAEADALNSDRVSAMKLTLPTGEIATMTNNITLTEFEFSEANLSSSTAFEERFAAGSYAFEITPAASGQNQHATVAFPAGDFPPAPDLKNLTAFPNHLASKDLTVSWSPWLSTTANDFIRVELTETDSGQKVWDTPNYTNEKHLRGNVSSVTIPYTNLVAGRNYRIDVRFFHLNITETQVIPGALVFGGFASRTRFEFSTQPSNVTRYEIAEGQVFWQRWTNRYEAEPSGAFHFDARVTGATASSLNSAELTVPQSGTFPLSADATGTTFTYTATESSGESLSQRFPAGDYTFVFRTATEGIRGVVLPVPSTALPPRPFIRSLQGHNFRRPTADFDIAWDLWVGANPATDSIRFTLYDPRGEIVVDSANGLKHPLTSASSRITIYGEKASQRELDSNLSYLARLRFERTIPSESSAYPGPRGTITIYSETAFFISTLINNPPFAQKYYYPNENGELQFGISDSSSLQSNRTYGLLETRDFFSWTLIQSGKVTNRTNAFRLMVPGEDRAFYRVVILP